MNRKFLWLAFTVSVWADGIDYNAAITVNYGDSYDFYSYTENRLDLNLFYNNIQAWVQYEYSNPPEIGFPINDIRKFRIEYMPLDFTIKLGDIYEFWGRGLVLNQFDDQVTNFDNGTRGLFLGYSKGPLTISHINGNTDIWELGNDLRVPRYKHIHNMYANQVLYDLSTLSLGLTNLHSNETHQKIFGAGANVDTSNNYTTRLYIDSDPIDWLLRFKQDITAGNADLSFKLDRLFRDPAAWYHFCVAVDTTQSTEANRVKIYINAKSQFPIGRVPPISALVDFLS